MTKIIILLSIRGSEFGYFFPITSWIILLKHVRRTRACAFVVIQIRTDNCCCSRERYTATETIIFCSVWGYELCCLLPTASQFILLKHVHRPRIITIIIIIRTNYHYISRDWYTNAKFIICFRIRGGEFGRLIPISSIAISLIHVHRTRVCTIIIILICANNGYISRYWYTTAKGIIDVPIGCSKFGCLIPVASRIILLKYIYSTRVFTVFIMFICSDNGYITRYRYTTTKEITFISVRCYQFGRLISMIFECWVWWISRWTNCWYWTWSCTWSSASLRSLCPHSCWSTDCWCWSGSISRTPASPRCFCPQLSLHRVDSRW